MSVKKNKQYSKVKFLNEKKTEIQTKINSLNQKLSDFDTQIDSYSQTASQLSERRMSDRTVEDIANEIQQTESIISTQEQLHGDSASIAREFNSRKNRLDSMKAEIKDFKECLKLLHHSINLRIENHLKLRNSISIRACMAFDTILKGRNYKGKMKIDHDNQVLEMNVKIPSLETNEMQDAAHLEQIQSSNMSKNKIAKLQQENVATLSGGERSFTTICFIVALWRIMSSPLRCLDEFDVFMDMINRRYSMDLLMNLASAERTSGVQFLFLTPLDMSYLDPSSYLTIYRINKTDRRTVMNAGAQVQGSEETDPEQTQ